MKLVAKVVLFSKFFALSCIAFMSSADAAVLPCHDVKVEIEKECEACVLSLEAWSEPLTKNSAAVLAEDPDTVVGFYSFEVFLEETVFFIPEIRPPPELVLWRGEEIFQSQIRLRL